MTCGGMIPDCFKNLRLPVLCAHGSGRESPHVPYHPQRGQPLNPVGLGDIDVVGGAGPGLVFMFMEQSPVLGTSIFKQILRGPLQSYCDDD